MNSSKSTGTVVRNLEMTPTSKGAKAPAKEFLLRAPRVLKQEEDYNTEVLNICCSDFNSLLFLTPPKIRAENTVPSPSNTKESAEVPLENEIQKELIKLVDYDAETHFVSTVLQNLTNLELDVQTTNKKKSFKFPEGGWVCSICQNYNFCGRVYCNRCGKTKAKEDHVGKPKHLLRKENNENEPLISTKPSKVKKQGKDRSGDWVCHSCKNVNFAFRQQCNRCKADKADHKRPGWSNPQYYPRYDYQGYSMAEQRQSMMFPLSM
eukprot:TRINITY_DN7115_c0_g2_i9.p1 TRINITY_DN7115_c0_g2~~TRINITY_DN7115_c0_g2_i9.p1  ORF type:complete len:264 (+),score=36.59 TRINITY_DN7115_c0_g2_i9:186-977(+)